MLVINKPKAQNLIDFVDVCYPSFGAYWNERTTPIMEKIIKDKILRQNMFGKLSPIDSDLSKLIRLLNEYASKEFFSISGWRSVNLSETVKQFLKDN